MSGDAALCGTTDALTGRPEAAPPSARRKIFALYAGLVPFNIAVWALAILAFHASPPLLGAAALAYTFGLRHAVDADHIAAIDNVTRRLMRDGRKPVCVGLFFALGHSTVVALAFAALAFGASAVAHRFGDFRALGSLIGTTVSVLFLFTIAAINMALLIGVFRSFNALNAPAASSHDLDLLAGDRGLAGRVFRPIFRLLHQSWHMYPLGFLFGLGFDTATEIGILGLSAAGIAHGATLGSLMLLPALFTAGMTLVDTTDSVLMIGAYGWAFVKPARKLYYNLSITFASVLVAVVVGAVEALGAIGARLGLDRGFWGVVATLNGGFGVLGYLIVGVFVLSWLGSAAIWRLNGYDRIEATPR